MHICSPSYMGEAKTVPCSFLFIFYRLFAEVTITFINTQPTARGGKRPLGCSYKHVKLAGTEQASGNQVMLMILPLRLSLSSNDRNTQNTKTFSFRLCYSLNCSKYYVCYQSYWWQPLERHDDTIPTQQSTWN